MKEEICCDEWTLALDYLSDSDCESKLIDDMGEGYYIGCGLLPIKFCPWCGASKHPEEREVVSE